MTTTSGHISLTEMRPNDGTAPVVRIPEHLRMAAAVRLLPDQPGDPTAAGQRFLESASALGIDLALMWGTMVPETAVVRQVCLAVMGSGRTAMLFVSGAERKGRAWTSAARFRAGGQAAVWSQEIGHRERVTLILHACGAVSGSGAVLAQALLEAREREAALALRDAGFTALGELVYMRRPLTAGAKLSPGVPERPTGISVRSVEDLLGEGHGEERIDAWLLEALERSYVETLDCPELCGLRGVSDVLTSHRAVGEYDPGIWWLIFEGEPPAPVGCLLLNVCPEHDSVELVYLGLAPGARGKGLGGAMMNLGLARLMERHIGVPESVGVGGRVRVRGTGGLTCAVDTRNAPAMHLYKRLGFVKFGERLPFVRGLRAAT